MRIVDCALLIIKNILLHIENISKKARVRGAMILNCFKCRNKEVLLKAFIAFVRPLLDYCSSLWSPFSKYDIDKLEKVQRRFTKDLMA